jgi:hypothetical protein
VAKRRLNGFLEKKLKKNRLEVFWKLKETRDSFWKGKSKEKTLKVSLVKA